VNNEIDPAIGSWYQHLDDGRVFQVVAVDDDQKLVEFQHFDGAIEEVSLNEWRSWDLTVTAAPEDWTGPVDDLERGDLGYSEVRSEGEQRELQPDRWREDLEAEESGPGEGVGARTAGVEATEEAREDGLSSKRIDQIRKRLADRREELRADIQRELRKYDDESYAELAGVVADSGDRAFGDLLSDVNLAEVTRDIDEVRGIEAAFDRLAEGKYGICLSCGGRIDRRRLEAHPAAVRCLECQRAFESRNREHRYPTL
jgi:RNA polymerase-binding protein DksA